MTQPVPPPPPIDIHPDHWAIVHRILQQHVPQHAVWAFGSRATGKAKPFSDLDLAIITDAALPPDVSASLRDDFSESDLPWKVDVIDWATTSEAFRAIVERDRVVVREGAKGLGLPKDWKAVALADLTLTPPTYGVVQPGQDSKDGVPMVRVNNFQGHTLDLTDVMRIAPEVEGKYGRTRIQTGDVLMTIVGSVGQVATVPDELNGWNIARAVAMIRPKERGLSRWISLVLRSPDAQNQLGVAANTTVQTTINLKDLRLLRIPFPEEGERNAITHVLGTLDDKIELLRKQNETLEAMARALFKAWFVDFEPVRAKLEGRWQPGQSLPGLPAHLYNLFPDRLVESELGEIPEGWGVVALDDVAQQGKGAVNPGAYPEGEFVHYSLPAFDAAQMPIVELGSQIKSNKTPLQDGAVLISKLNPHIPRIWLVGEAGDNAVCSTEFIVWMPKKPASSAFLYCLASSEEFNSAMRQLVTGTSNSHQRVKPEQLREIRVIAARDEEIEELSSVIESSVNQVLHNRKQSRFLAQLRDALLPKLISGELRVLDAERIVGASV